MMDVNKPNNIGATYIPQQAVNVPNKKSDSSEKRSVVIEHANDTPNKNYSRIDLGDANTLAKASEIAQTVEKLNNDPEQANRQILAYQSLELQNKKDAVSEIMGVDVYV